MEELGSLTTLSMASVRASRIGAEMNTTLIESKVASLTTLSTDLATQYANIDSMITTLKNADNTTLTDLGTANTLAAKKMSVNCQIGAMSYPVIFHTGSRLKCNQDRMLHYQSK